VIHDFTTPKQYFTYLQNVIVVNSGASFVIGINKKYRNYGDSIVFRWELQVPQNTGTPHQTATS
jgi:hypothetical protein